GFSHHMTGAYDKAIGDYTEAIRLNPKHATAYYNRGLAYTAKKEHDKVIQDFTEAIRLVPEMANAHVALSWLLATCPKDGVRDGKRAVEHARQACELLGWKETNSLEALAAAYAECGNFKEAVKWQKKAVELGNDNKDELEGARQRLQVYEQGKPL